MDAYWRRFCINSMVAFYQESEIGDVAKMVQRSGTLFPAIVRSMLTIPAAFAVLNADERSLRRFRGAVSPRVKPRTDQICSGLPHILYGRPLFLRLFSAFHAGLSATE